MENAATTLAGLSIERLRSFLRIIEAGSFVAAAERNPVRQSQFSRQMRELERTFGTPLFERKGRQLRPTASGIRLAALTRAYFRSLNTLGDDELRERPLKLGAGESIIRWFLVPRIRRVMAAARAPVILENYPTSELWRRLEEGELDVAILRAESVGSSGTALAFPSATYILMVPRALAPLRRIREQGELPVVLLDGEDGFEANAARIAQANGFALKILVRVRSFNLVMTIAANLGVAAFVPSAAQAEIPADQFVIVPLKGLARLTRRLAVAYNRKISALDDRAQSLAEKLSEEFAG